jgi:hypothetical protein
MKFGNGKKKNLKIDHSFDNLGHIGIINFNTQTINGVSARLIEKRLNANNFKIPKGYSCYCHCCDLPFKSIEEMQKHNKKTEHQRNKEIYLQVKL